MTLIDTRPGFAATLAGARRGDRRADRRGGDRAPPRPAARPAARAVLPAGADRPASSTAFRAHYPAHAIAPTLALPGAHEALAAVRRHGGRTVLVTGKFTPNAQLHVDALGFGVDALRRRGVGRRQGRRADRARRHRLRRRPRPRRRGGPGRRGAQRLGADRRLHRAGAVATPGPTWCSRDLDRVPGLARRHVLDLRLAALEDRLRELGSVLVAYSGGADSAFLLAAAVRALGPRARRARRRRTPTRCPQGERTPARDFAESLGVRVLTPRDPRDGAGGLPRQRRRPLLLLQGRAARRARPARRPSTGSPTSPPAPTPTTRVAGFRPGIRAAAERGAVTPLRDAGLHQGAGARRLPGVGPADLGQAGRGLPVQPGRLRHRGQPVPAGPGRAGRGGRAGRAGRGRPRRARPPGARPRRPAPASRSTPRSWTAARGAAGGWSPRCSPPASRRRGGPARVPVRGA